MDNIIDIEEVSKQFAGMSSGDLLKLRDGGRIPDSAISMELWKRQAAGEKIFTDTNYIPEERIKYYTDRGNKYISYTQTSGVTKVLELLGTFLPGIFVQIIKSIFHL